MSRTHPPTVARAEDSPSSLGDIGRIAWKLGRIRLDESKLELRLDNEIVNVEPKPLELLMFMLRRAGEVVTREEILEALWPGRVVTDGVITNCVAKLRIAIGDDQQSIVRTVPRYGYRLVAEVQRQRLSTETAPVTEHLGLKPGDLVPGRPDWRLQRSLSAEGQSEVWLAGCTTSDEQRVIKFARNAGELALLKREITLNRVLSETLETSSSFVRVLDWNLEEPPFFLETEYSAHGSLADWVGARGGLAALPLELRVELAAQCASAVADAHSAGVLHKDLKPTNVIVFEDADGHPSLRLCDFAAGWVLDAAILDRLSITRMGFTQTQKSGASGTPMYLAPEVIAGQPPTVQADVYALGVILFQLVVGDLRRVLAPGWEAAVDDELLREDIAMAADGDPARRFTDAGQMAVRLRSLPARRVAWLQRREQSNQADLTRAALLRAQARRGLLIALAGSLTLGALVIGLLYWNARQARDEAREQAHASQAISDFLTQDLLSFANPLATGSGDVRVRDLLDAGATRLSERFAGQPLTRARLEKVIGGAYGALGDLSRAEPLLLGAESSLSQLLGDADPETQSVRLLLRDSYRIALDFKKMQAVALRLRDAEVAAGRERSAAWYEGELGVRFAGCVVESGGLWLTDCSAPVLPLIPDARADLGAEHLVTARLLWNSGASKVHFERPAQAESLLAEALGILSRQLMPGDPWLLEVRLYHAYALSAKGHYEQGEAIIREVLQGLEATVGRQQGFYKIAQVMLARSLINRGLHAQAEPLLQEAFDWRRERYGPLAVATMAGLPPLVRALLAQGKAGQGVALLGGLLDQIQDRGQSQHPDVLRVRVLYARALKAAGRGAEAWPVLEQALTEARQRYTRGEWYLGQLLALRGGWLLETGQAEAGRADLAQALQILTAALGVDDDRTREVQMVLDAARARKPSP